MLTSLYVRNFAVVEAADIALGPGLTAVTGETGAGKSLMVDALTLLSGARADSAMVRAGCKRAELSASFDLTHLPAARAWLQEAELDEDDECRLRRVIRAEGSSRAWINARPVTLAQVAELSALLLEIHGQHEHQALLSRAHQLALLDAIAGNGAHLDIVRQHARRWRELGRTIKTLSGGEDRETRLALLRHECEQLQQWALTPEALQDLENEHRRLANAERLLEGAAALGEMLGSEQEFSATATLARAHAESSRLLDIDARLQPVVDLLDTAQIQLGEAVAALDHYGSDLELDPERYTQVDDHMEQLHQLSRRHRVPAAELSGKAQALAEELDTLEHAGEALQRACAERETCANAYAAAAADLRASRREGAERLSRDVSALMQELGMSGGRLEVQFNQIDSEDPDPQGTERCELMVSANPGQPLRALRKVASGGELARISLAIEVAALDTDAVGTMVFDEVDAGIGGAVAEVVGQKLRALGAQRQVLCVTHLAQVAAQAHAQLKVVKHSDSESDTTHTRIDALDEAARKDELARMLGGIEMTRETRAHAKKMLQQAQK